MLEGVKPIVLPPVTPPPVALPVATVEDGCVTFPGGIQALSGIDLALAPGTITALVGESGSGKTTLCRVLAGLQPLTSGRATVAGEPVGPRMHRRVQMLLQDAPGSLSPRMTVRALLAEPGAIHGLDRGKSATKTASIMRQLGLGPGLMERYPHQLSGGQARRVAMARALLLTPKLLIADEPTAGLDLSVQGELLNLLLSVQHDQSLPMLVSTHNLSVIRRLAVDLIVMYRGQVIERGATDSILSRPQHPYTQALLSAQPSLDPAARRTRIVLRGDPPSVVHPPPGCRFHTRCPYAAPVCTTDLPPWQGDEGSVARCHFRVPKLNNLAVS